MNLTEYMRILMRRGWILILLALIIGSGAYLLTRQQTPVYRATQKVVLQPSRADLGLAEASIRLLNSLVVIIDSQEIAQRIIDENRLDVLSGQLIEDVTIAPDQLRLTIQIDVDSTDPALANLVARAWGQKLKDYRDELNQQSRREDRIVADMPDQPSLAQIAPRPRVSAAAGAILGLIIGGIIIFILEFLESSIIQRSEDLERTLDVPVLASIPGFDR